MSDVGESLVRLAKGASVVFIGTIIGRVLALAGQILIVRALPPNLYGKMALAFSIVASLAGILVLGAPQGVTRLIAATEDNETRREYLQSGLLIASIGGIIGSCVIYFNRFRIQQLMSTPELTPLLSIFLIYLLISPIRQVMIGGLRGFKRPEARVLAKDIFARVTGLIILSGFLVSGEPFLGTIVYWLSVPFLILVGSLYFLNQSISIGGLIRQSPSISSIQKFLTFSWPLAFSASFVLLMSQLDILMIGVFLPARDVGLYRAVQPLKEIVLFFLTSFVFLYLPIATEYYVEDKYSDLHDLYLTSTKWIVSVTFPIVVTTTLFANDIIGSLFGKSYTPASTAFAILVLGMFTRVFVGPNGATIQAINRSEIEMYASLAGLVVNVGLNITLIPLIGIEGAAIATSFGFVIYNLIEIFVIYRETGIVPVSKTIVIPLIPTTIMGIVTIMMLRAWTFNLPLLILVTLLLGIFHILSVVITGNLEEKDLLLLEEVEQNTSLDLSKARLYLKRHID